MNNAPRSIPLDTPADAVRSRVGQLRLHHSGWCDESLPVWLRGRSEKECTCSPTLISRYQKRLSGPLLDRTLAPALRSGASAGVDIHIEVPRVPFHTCPSAAPRAVPRGKLSDDRHGEPSAAIRGRVEAARARQTARFAAAVGADGHLPLHTTNADMGPTEVRDHCAVDEAGRSVLLGTAMRHTCPGAARQGRCRGMHLSVRAPGPNRRAGAGYHRILKLARTIADLAGAERTPALHLRWCRCKCPAGAYRRGDPVPAEAAGVVERHIAGDRHPNNDGSAAAEPNSVELCRKTLQDAVGQTAWRFQQAHLSVPRSTDRHYLLL